MDGRVIISSMNSIDDFLKEFPPSVCRKLKQLWEALPASLQQELEMLIKAIPSAYSGEVGHLFQGSWPPPERSDAGVFL
jgi:hypothetical protein